MGQAPARGARIRGVRGLERAIPFECPKARLLGLVEGATASSDIMALLSWFNSAHKPPSSAHSVRRRQARLVSRVAIGAGLWAPNVLAQDDDVKACAEAYEQAQVTRNSGKLKESEAHLRVCVRDVCPDFVKVDCGQWLSDVRREMPSVILMVTDGNGNELTDVQVTIDGTVHPAAVDGRAFEINPGPHEFTFEREGTKRSERVSIRQGEKNRVIKIELVTRSDGDNDGVFDADDRCPTQAGDPSNGGCPVPVAPVIVRQTGLNGLETGAIVAAGVGILGFGTFAVAGTWSRLNTSEALKECGDDGDGCSPAKVEEYQDKEGLLNPIANIGAIVGGVGVATAVVLYALSLEDNSADVQVGNVSLNVSPIRGGAWFGAHTRF